MAKLKLPNSYFPHDFNARLDRKILRMRKVLGIEGYGIFWMLIEVLAVQEDFSYPLADIDLLADEFGTSNEKVESVIKQFGLFKIDRDAKFFSLSLIARMQKYIEISERARLAANKRWEKAQKLKESNANALQMHSDGNAIKEKDIKEQERKGNKKKEKDFKKLFVEDSNEFRLSKLLYDLMLINNPKAKKPNLQNWCKHIERMHRIDERSYEEIEGAIRWSQQDSFWLKNILSTETLRRKYDRLYLGAKNGGQNGKSNFTESEIRELSESIANDPRYK